MFGRKKNAARPKPRCAAKTMSGFRPDHHRRLEGDVVHGARFRREGGAEIFVAVLLLRLLLLQLLLLPQLLFVLLLLIYTYVPGGRRTLRSQLQGTIFATAGWLIFSRVFSFYIAHFWRRSYIYGSLTAVILLILWLYVIINLLFIGAGLNAELLPKGFSRRGVAVSKAE